MITHPLIVIPVNLPENMIYIYINTWFIFGVLITHSMIKPRKNIEQTHPWKKVSVWSMFSSKNNAPEKNIAPRAISQAHQLVKPTLRTILMDHIPPTTLERLSHWQMIFLKIYISNWIVYRNKELSIRSKTLAARPPARAH
jgi:hypothetical protein